MMRSLLRKTRKLWPPKRDWRGGFLHFLAPRPAALALLRKTRKLWPPKRGWRGGFLHFLAPRPAALALLREETILVFFGGGELYR